MHGKQIPLKLDFAAVDITHNDDQQCTYNTWQPQEQAKEAPLTSEGNVTASHTQVHRDEEDGLSYRSSRIPSISHGSQRGTEARRGHISARRGAPFQGGLAWGGTCGGLAQIELSRRLWRDARRLPRFGEGHEGLAWVWCIVLYKPLNQPGPVHDSTRRSRSRLDRESKASYFRRDGQICPKGGCRGTYHQAQAELCCMQAQAL